MIRTCYSSTNSCATMNVESKSLLWCRGPRRIGLRAQCIAPRPAAFSAVVCSVTAVGRDTVEMTDGEAGQRQADKQRGR